MKLACEPDSKRAHSFNGSPNEFQIVTRDKAGKTVFISLSALKCQVVNCLVDSILLEFEFIPGVMIGKLLFRSMKQDMMFDFALTASELRWARIRRVECRDSKEVKKSCLSLSNLCLSARHILLVCEQA